MEDFEIPEQGMDQRTLWRYVAPIAEALNGLSNFSAQPGDKWELKWAVGNAILIYPKSLAKSGGGGDDDDDDDETATYLVVVNGEIGYQDFLVSGPVRATFES